jgi:elongation factor G
MDWMVQEQERGITISSPPPLLLRDHRINIIDTRGTRFHHRGGALAPGSRRACRVRRRAASCPDRYRVAAAERYNVPSMTRQQMDRRGGLLPVRGHVRDRLGAKPVPLQIPIGAEDTYGVGDLIRGEAIFFDDAT